MAAVYKSLTKNATPSKTADESQNEGGRKNKQRVLILSSRGVTYRHRHLLKDLADLMPHARKEAKYDSKQNLQGLCELAHLYNTNNVTYFLARKGKDLYIYFSKVPNGPTVKMLAENIHTTDDLNMPGNCLKGSRPILSFDSAFDKEPHLKLIKELFTHTFGVPPGARKSKPFIDRVMSFTMADNKIWVRNYEIREVEKTKDGEKDEESASSKKVGGRDTDISLVEIGPRFVLTPILCQEGAFGGPIIYENKRYVSPNQVRSDIRKAKAGRHNLRVEQHKEKVSRKEKLGFQANGTKVVKKDSLDTRELFA